MKRPDLDTALRHEAPAAAAISLAAHVDEHTIVTAAGDYLQTFELDGVSHETASEQEQTVWHETLCQFAKAIGSANTALWTYLIRVPLQSYPDGDFAPGYAHGLNDRYRRHVMREGQYGTRLVLALIHRPVVSRLDLLGRRLERRRAEHLQAERAVAIERLTGLDRDVHKWLARWSPRRLGVYQRNRLLFSESLELYGLIVNGYWQPMPLRRSNVAETLMTSRAFFGRESFELRGPESSLYGAMLEFKEFPEEVWAGCLDEVLKINAPIVLVQSFAFLDRSDARGQIMDQAYRLAATDDDAHTQREALGEARDDLASSRYMMGHHHITMMARTPVQAALPGLIAEARQALAAGGGVVTRASLEMEAAFWSALPGAFSKRPRPALLGSRQWAALNAMHAYPTGRPSGNHWGPALLLLRTASGSPFFLNLHQGDVGHFCMLGSTGSGKTVLLLLLVAMMTRLGVQVTFFDKDRAAEIAIRALGGRYFAFRPRERTGLAPFARPATDENLAAITQLMRAILRNGETPLSSRELTEIDQAVAGAMPMGRMAHMMEFLEPPANNNLADRLRRWVQTVEGPGPLAWVFDNDEDEFDLDASHINAIDMTYFLQDPEICTPIMIYLQHRMDQLKDGRRTAMLIDEGWKALDDPLLAAQITNAFNTDRKKNALVGLITQSPSQALRSHSARTIVEQTPTKIFLPNIEAKREEYVDGFGLTDGEFERFKELTAESHRFLVKQGNDSVICELDLNGFYDDLSILSGTPGSVRRLHEVLATHGPDPANWIPAFLSKENTA